MITSTAPTSVDEKKDGISFQEYLDLFWAISDDESLTEEQQNDLIGKRLDEMGISEERQAELAGEMLQAFHNPQPAAVAT